MNISFPEQSLEREIVMTRVPGISERLTAQLVSFIHQVRKLDIKKLPSVSETIDWAKTLVILHAESLDGELVRDTMNTFLKSREDIRVAEEKLHPLTDHAMKEAT